MSKKKVPHFVRWRYAMDATPEIKGVEASPAALTDAKAVIDAQEAGVAPRNIGLDLDKDASIDEIVLKFFPGASPEDAETIRGLLMKYKTAPATMEVEDDDEPLTAAAPEAVPAATGAVKDGDTPDEQRAFAEGVKYGEEEEKEEPVHLDRLHESEGMKRYEEEKDKPATDEDKDAKIQEILASFPELDEEQKKKLSDALNDLAYSAATGEDEEPEEEQKAFAEGVDYGEKKEKEGLAKDSKPRRRMAMDAASIKRRVREEMMADFKARSRAASQVRGVLGNIDVMAFDSAEAIYGEALRKVGINTRQYAPSSYAAMFAAYNTNRSNGRPVAQDAKPIEFSGAFANLKNIKIGD